MTIIRSSTERGQVVRHLESLCRNHEPPIPLLSSQLPERYGLDFAWFGVSADTYTGVQRKELNDYLASIGDGRLAREVAQMTAHADRPLLVIEGRIDVVGGEVVAGKYGRPITYHALVKQQLTMMNRGIDIMRTDGPTQTAELIVAAWEWDQKPASDHTTAASRPKPTGAWGTPSNREWQMHMLQGIDGVGRVMAGAIVDELGWRLRMDATVDELCQVPGIGRKTAEKILAGINQEHEEEGGGR